MKGEKMTDYWTEEEIELVYTNMTNAEIEQKTGRSKAAVRKMRYKKTGHYVERNRQREIKSMYSPKPYASAYSKKARIIALAQKLGVKLYG